MLGNPQILRVAVEGHTDGREAKQRGLGQRRAEAVAAYLRGKGVLPARLVVEDRGAGQPLDPGTTRDGRAKNRRVEWWILERRDDPPQAPAERP
jgi:outer membrane protein OmpA-like peptidoglycan-associated protein